MLRTTIVYESMFGATRGIAESIARGVREAGGAQIDVVLRSVADVEAADITGADVLVVGGPTHAHSLSRPASRTEAEQWAEGKKQGLTLEPGALQLGVRELIDELPSTSAAFVAFGTRADGPALFMGSAAKAIEKRLTRHGLRALLPPQAFLVDATSHLVDGERTRAEQLGRTLVEAARRSDRSSTALTGS